MAKKKTSPKAFNRIKLMLLVTRKSSKWLAGKLDVNEATVSLWCTNSIQPSVETFYQIAKLLDVEVRKLIEPTKEKDE